MSKQDENIRFPSCLFCEEQFYIRRKLNTLQDMICHMVWFKLRDDVSPDDKTFLKSQLEGMVPLIPEIVELSCGEDFSGRSRGFGWGLMVKFNSREDGQIYDKHPDHQAFIGRCKHLWTEVQALDFEY